MGSRQIGRILITTRPLESLIHVIRGRKVILNADMAILYHVETKALNQVHRGGRRYLPYSFTEHGVVMLSSVLTSQRAGQVNIFVAQAFIRMREIIAGNKKLAARVEKLERGHDDTASVIEILVDDIDRLTDEVQQMKAIPSRPKRRIGFRAGSEDEERRL